MQNELSYKLETFEGPLDLLLHLIEKNKINIYDIPISEITDQYMAYVNAMEKEDLDMVSDFLVMAATLLDLKARMLLPKEVDEETGEEEDPRKELVERLLEYKKYRLMAEELSDREFDAVRRLYHSQDLPEEVAKYVPPVDLAQLFQGVDLVKLGQVFRDVMRRQEYRVDPQRSRFGTIRREPVSLKESMQGLAEYAKKHRRFSFRELLKKSSTRTEIVVTFLAVLEFMKAGKLTTVQENLFDDIEIETREHAFDEAVDFSDLDEF